MKKRYTIGIDPGKNTGVAIYNRENKKFVEVTPSTFCAVIEYIPLMYPPELVHKLIIEKPTTKAIFHKSSSTTIAVNVGMNRREAELLIEYFQKKGYNVVSAHPRGKIKSDLFKRITGWDGRTNEHTRDAGMLAFGV